MTSGAVTLQPRFSVQVEGGAAYPHSKSCSSRAATAASGLSRVHSPLCSAALPLPPFWSNSVTRTVTRTARVLNRRYRKADRSRTSLQSPLSDKSLSLISLTTLIRDLNFHGLGEDGTSTITEDRYSDFWLWTSPVQKPAGGWESRHPRRVTAPRLATGTRGKRHAGLLCSGKGLPGGSPGSGLQQPPGRQRARQRGGRERGTGEPSDPAKGSRYFANQRLPLSQGTKSVPFTSSLLMPFQGRQAMQPLEHGLRRTASPARDLPCMPAPGQLAKAATEHLPAPGLATPAIWAFLNFSVARTGAARARPAARPQSLRKSPISSSR